MKNFNYIVLPILVKQSWMNWLYWKLNKLSTIFSGQRPDAAVFFSIHWANKNTVLSLLVLFNLFIAQPSFGQDIHFSKFYNAPLILNPANTGNFTGNWRFISNYRKQAKDLSEPYVTSTVAFDIPVYYYTQMASLGLIYANDASSDKTLNTNKLYVSLAHFVRISQKSYLHLGLQFGVVHKNFTRASLSFPDQFDISSGYFNTNLPTNENMETENVFYPDFNWGLIWSRKSESFNSEMGFAMFHYNKPDENFGPTETELPVRYSFHAFLEKRIAEKYFIKPKALYNYQNKINETFLGTDVGALFSANSSLQNVNIGAYYRNGLNRNSDVLIAKFGIKLKTWELGFSYDFEINKSDDIYPKTAFEISLIYLRPSTNIKNKIIPCSVF